MQWSISDRLRLLPGLRLNYDKKDVDFNQQTYGGLQTTNPALIALQQSVLAPQAYKANVDDTNLSGQITAAYKIAEPVNVYATYATGFKSVGLNLNGLPTDANNQPVLSSAIIKPEDVRNYEAGIKATPFRNVTTNIAFFDTEIKNFQAQVTNGSVGVIRGYLANAGKVRVRGVEFDGNARVNPHLYLYSAIAYTDGRVRDVCRRAAAARGDRRTAVEGHLGLAAPWHLEVGAFGGRRSVASRRDCRPLRRVLRGHRHQLPVVVFLESRRTRRTWSFPATRCSTPASASASPADGRSPCGRATSSTRTTSIC